MRFKMDLKNILSTILITSLICGLTIADTATVERIRKHQEWLRQRNQGRSNLLSTSKPKKSVELLNLWRFNKKEIANSINDVYPENDNILTKTATTTSTTNTTPKITTIKTTFPTITTNSVTVTTTPKPTVSTNTTTATTTTTTTTIDDIFQKTSAAPFYNSIPRFDSNFYLKSSTTNDWLSNDILETTTPFTNTTSTSAAPTTISTSTTLLKISTTTKATTTTRKPKIRPYPRWGNWGDWSDCSRSCGGGIKHQLRKCINRNSLTGKLHLSRNCVGVYKRYQLCNDQPCPAHQEDFRALQCSSYNNVDFQGQQFLWEPYIKDDAECELNCKPLGMKYFATLNSTVIDGTPCEKPAEYYRLKYKGRAVCIDGICKVC